MRFLFGGFTLLFFFGSLSRFTPNIPWNDASILFRKNKTDYINFSNKIRGIYCLVLGILCLLIFLSSFIFDYPNNESTVFIGFCSVVFLTIILEILVEIKWRHKQKK